MKTLSRAAFIGSVALLAACSYKYPAPGGIASGDPIPWNVLFNGKNLDGWKPFLPDAKADPAGTWTVQDGILRCTGKPVGYLATTGEYKDYELEVEWRFDPSKGPGNSGVLLRVQNKDEVWPKSIEAQLNSGDAGDIWNIGNFAMKVDPKRTEGRRTVKMGKCSEGPLGFWNRYRIIVDGGRIELYVNGEHQNSATDAEHVAGRIALQSEGANIEFRMVRVRPLTGDGTGRGYER